MANYVFVAKSIDGFIAMKDGSTDWLDIPNPEKTDYGFVEFSKKVDAIIMGRLTFEKALTYKPYPYTKPVFVLSNSLKTIPINLQDSTEIVNGDLKNIIENINNKGYNNLYIDGAGTIQSFLKENLIDEINIITLPVILGNGIPLFKEINKTIYFNHERTKTYENGVVKTVYIK